MEVHPQSTLIPLKVVHSVLVNIINVVAHNKLADNRPSVVDSRLRLVFSSHSVEDCRLKLVISRRNVEDCRLKSMDKFKFQLRQQDVQLASQRLAKVRLT
jgi:hypothetical protein